jgi:hypothetical protein
MRGIAKVVMGVATRIVELCSVANAVEAHSICAILVQAGVHATVVGEFVGNAAGIGHIGGPAAPRIWVKDDDLERARGILDQWLQQRPQQGFEDSPDDGYDSTDAPPGQTSCSLTGLLIRIGCWTIGAFVILSSLAMFALMLYEFLRALLLCNSTGDLAEFGLMAFFCVALAVLTGLLLKKRLRWVSMQYPHRCRDSASLDYRTEEGVKPTKE